MYTIRARPRLANRTFSFCRSPILPLCFLWLSAAATASQVAGDATTVSHKRASEAIQPNIILVLTDDQDLHLASLDYMPHLQTHLVKGGTSFHNHYCTIALCCPSRVSLWTGLHGHNTNVTDINPPHGGYPKFVSRGYNDDYFPIWMQRAGYNTYYTGKFLNAQSTSNYNKPYPKGWNISDFLLDPFTYEYLNATMQRNEELWDRKPLHGTPRSYEGLYVTDVIANKSLDMLRHALHTDNQRPFFLAIAPTAPHSNVHINIDLSDGHSNYSEVTAVQSPPVAASRHEHLFKEVIVPRTPDFNPDQDNEVSWLRLLPKQNQSNVDSNDHFYRQRLRALQSVDELIPPLIDILQEAKALDNTYIVYTSDNGYHIGQHRLQPGKQCAFATDVNVPMIIRGPNVPKDWTTDVVSSHVDLAPTFLRLAGLSKVDLENDYVLDGSAIDLSALKPSESAPNILSSRLQEHVNIEMWGVIMSEGKYGSTLYPYHTYKAVRMIADDKSYNLLYIVWCTNEHELYDLNTDPYALLNIFPTANITGTMKSDPSQVVLGDDHFIRPASQVINTEDKHSLVKLVHRLDAALMVLKTCKGKQCVQPWHELHPPSNSTRSVLSLRDALHSEFDQFYAERVERVSFSKCEQAQILSSEGAMWPGFDGMMTPIPEFMT